MDDVEVKVESEPDAAASASPEAISDAAAVAVATAGAAAALAHETSAHAELQAAEETAAVAAEADEWRTETRAMLSVLAEQQSIQNEQLTSLASLAQERANASSDLLARLLKLEEAEASRSSTPPASEGESPEERTAAAPIVGTEAAANLGPAEVAGSASLSSNPEPAASETASQRARKRWI